MKNVIIKNLSGSYYVEGSGFVGTNQSNATRLTAEDAACTLKCAAKMGISASTETVIQKSFAVVYIRAKDVTASGTIQKQPTNSALNEVDPSKRRFATFGEAVQHGSRFPVRRKNRGDQPGTAGHRGFFVVETTDPVNAWVNPATGLTNRL